MKTAQSDALRAEFKRFLQSPVSRWVNRRVLRRCDSLVLLSPVLKELENPSGRDLGVKDVRLSKIVGSSGKSQDFTLNFRPTRISQADRWVDVASARLQLGRLPPVQLTKIGEAYFADDGNHRISIAQSFGEKTIKAHIVELDPAGLKPQPSCERLGYQLKVRKPCK